MAANHTPGTGDLVQGFDYFEDSYLSKWFLSPWEKANKDLYSYHPVLVPPTEQFQSQQDADNWVQATRIALTTPTPVLGGQCPLDCPTGSDPSKHLVILQGTEFGFNKYASTSRAKGWTADSSRPVRWEWFQVALRGLYEVVNDARFQATTIIAAFSATVDYGPLPPDEDKVVRNLAENAVFVFDNKTTGFQKISKFMRSGADKFNTQLFFDFHENRVGQRDPAILDSPERRREMTHSIPNFGGAGQGLNIGVATCLDASFATIPGTQLILLLSGGAVKSNTQERSVGSIMVNDAEAWGGPNDMPTVGEWFAKDPVQIGNYKNANWNPMVMAGFLEAYSPYFNHDVLDKYGNPKNGEMDPSTKKWLDQLRIRPMPAGEANGFKTATQMAWPLTIDEGRWFYTQGDYIKLAGSSIVCGASRKMPKAPMKLGDDNVLAPMEMHQFLNLDEFEDVRNVLSAAIQKGSLSEIARTELYVSARNQFLETKAQNRPAWEWAQRLAETIKRNAAAAGLPANYPDAGPSGVRDDDVRGPMTQ